MIELNRRSHNSVMAANAGTTMASIDTRKSYHVSKWSWLSNGPWAGTSGKLYGWYVVDDMLQNGCTNVKFKRCKKSTTEFMASWYCCWWVLSSITTSSYRDGVCALHHSSMDQLPDFISNNVLPYSFMAYILYISFMLIQVDIYWLCEGSDAFVRSRCFLRSRAQILSFWLSIVWRVLEKKLELVPESGNGRLTDTKIAKSLVSLTTDNWQNIKWTINMHGLIIYIWCSK